MTIGENRGRAETWLLLSALVVLADQVSKAYIAGHFLEFEFVRILPVLDITCMHNVGAAFSFLASASGWQRWVFIGLAVAVSIGITIWLFRLPRDGQCHRSDPAGVRDRFHSLSLGTGVFSGIQRRGFRDYGRRCVPITRCLF